MFRPLHYVFRLGNRNDIQNFFINILAMKVLRHEEFSEGCEATCNGPYNGRWSKTMVGYGEEDSHFAIELTYNYGVGSYRHSNDLRWIKVVSREVAENVKKADYPSLKIDSEDGEGESALVTGPDGYKFLVVDGGDDSGNVDKVTGLCLATNNLQASIDYYCCLLPGTLVSSSDKLSTVMFTDYTMKIVFEQVSEEIVKTTASGRLAFSYDEQLSEIENKIKKNNLKIKTSLIKLETPGKASVEVVILLDPNDHEICVVGDVGFRELSKIDLSAKAILDKAVDKDKSEQWFKKKGGKKTSL